MTFWYRFHYSFVTIGLRSPILSQLCDDRKQQGRNIVRCSLSRFEKSDRLEQPCQRRRFIGLCRREEFAHTRLAELQAGSICRLGDAVSHDEHLVSWRKLDGSRFVRGGVNETERWSAKRCKLFNLPACPPQQWRQMAGAHVGKLSALGIEGCEQERYKHPGCVVVAERSIDQSGSARGIAEQGFSVRPGGDSSNERVGACHEQSRPCTLVRHIAERQHQ